MSFLYLPRLVLNFTHFGLLLYCFHLLGALLLLYLLRLFLLWRLILIRNSLLPPLSEVRLQLANLLEHGFLKQTLRVSFFERVLSLFNYSCLQKPNGFDDVHPTLEFHLRLERLVLHKSKLELDRERVCVGEALIGHKAPPDNQPR